MMDAGRHRNITVLTNSTVESVSGHIGQFHARVRRRARYVDEKACTACGSCAEVCPVAVPDEFQEGLSSRRAIYIPFPQAVPSSYVIDMNACLGTNPIACGKCVDACDKKCIDLEARDELIDIDVGSIVVATGLAIYDPRKTGEHGYGRFENVLTSMEFERLINAGGPTEGHLVRPSDRKTPRRVGFVQCVGSRCPARGAAYCSNFCCMNTIKETLLLAEHYPDSESVVFYTDIRAFGKSFEDLYRRARGLGVRFLRGIPGGVEEDPATRSLTVTAEDTLTGKIERVELDMLVLAVGFVPRHLAALAGDGDGDGDGDPKKLLSLSTTSDGFVLEAHPKLKPVDAPTRGVFFAGCVEGPKDIKDSVTQASAAAARAGILLAGGKVRIEALTARIDPAACNFCGRCVRVCPFGAITPCSKKEGRYPSVVEAACAGCGTCSAECPTDTISMRHFSDAAILAQIDAILADRPLEKIVAFACNWCSYAGADNAGTSRLQYPPSVRLVRTMCSGRVDQEFIWHAFERGAPLVLVSGCHFADCHYINAVTWTQQRIEKVWTEMDSLGIRPERLQLEWISAAEGQKFARVMRELDRLLREVTPEEVERSREIAAERRRAAARKRAKEREPARAAPAGKGGA